MIDYLYWILVGFFIVLLLVHVFLMGILAAKWIK